MTYAQWVIPIVTANIINAVTYPDKFLYSGSSAHGLENEEIVKIEENIKKHKTLSDINVGEE